VNEPLYVHTTGVNSLSDIHGRVAGAMSGLTGSAPDASSLAAAYGSISSAFMAAMGHALPSRDESFQATQTSSQTIGELLQKAAQMYEQGDQQNADELKAAAEALAGFDGVGLAGSPTGANAAGSTGTTCAAGGGGPDVAGQMASQIGQQVGQIVQGLAQSVQGLAQGLTQLPQQMMQGVQGTAGSVNGRDGIEAAHEADEEKADDDKERDKDDEREGEGDEREAKDRHAPATHTGGAQPGSGGESGRAPVPPPPTERPQPAQTRPQQSLR
jgi:hypothetical protein